MVFYIEAPKEFTKKNLLELISTGLAKKFLRFLSKNRRPIFHFHQKLYWTTYSPFCSTTFCHFSGNFIIPSSQNLLSFWAKNCSRCLLQSSRELKFFSLSEFWKDRNKWKSKGAMSGEYGRWIRISQPSCNSFCLIIKKHALLRYPDGRLCVFCWLILDAFRWVLLSVGLIRSSTCWNESFGFPEGAHNRGFPSNPTIYTTSPSLAEDHPLVWLVVVHFACHMISSVPHSCTVSTFHHPSHFVLKAERFHYV